MTKLERIEKDIEKTRDKISEYQSKLKTLELKKVESENLEIVKLARTVDMSFAELVVFLKNAAKQQQIPKRETSQIIKTENQEVKRNDKEER